MNKQEAIEKIKHTDTLTIVDHTERHEVAMVNKNNVLDIISQIDEPEKVVVPKFVARWIEESKYDRFYALHGAYANMDEGMKRWRSRGRNSELFAKAWIAYPNITIEEDKRYTVEIAGSILTRIARGNTVEYKMMEVKNTHFTTYDLEKNAIHTTILTEEDIKEADERLWQFAKEFKHL
jgi:hypothetical protein